jgi:hypothetical protein
MPDRVRMARRGTNDLELVAQVSEWLAPYRHTQCGANPLGQRQARSALVMLPFSSKMRPRSA